MARVLLGVCGGIAAYKSLELVRLATKAGHAVRVVMTPDAERFVGRSSFAGLTGAPVLSDPWERDPARGAFPDQDAPSHDPLSHLELVHNADCFLVAPATAHTLARMAAGLADDLLGAAYLAARCPVVVAPAMNDAMYTHPATQENLRTLAARGATVLEPGTGALGSKGEWGVGRLPEPAELLAAVERAVGGGVAQDWAGRSVLVTAGGTREPIDAVRFVGNRSSGRMGFALAEAAADRGARVTVVAANVGLPRDARIGYVDVGSAAELEAACEERFADCDVLLMAAAVADFRPVDPAGHKLKKAGRDELVVTLEATPDVLAGLSRRRREGQVLVGFAAETGEGALDYGARKLVEKGLDAVVVNDVAQAGIGFDASENAVTVLTSGHARTVERAAKADVARVILDVVDELRGPTPEPQR